MEQQGEPEVDERIGLVVRCETHPSQWVDFPLVVNPNEPLQRIQVHLPDQPQPLFQLLFLFNPLPPDQLEPPQLQLHPPDQP